MNKLPTRQVHLDFHTSPLIPDLLSEWDVKAFADTMLHSHINSVTVFAKCHHGMSYYPTELGQPHPGLGGRDLLGEMLEALHKRGIRAPIYYTVGWDERLAGLHPDWRQLKPDGTFALATADAQPQPGAWKFMSYLHPEYLEHMRAEVQEILGRYRVDGMFFDIVFSHPQAGFEEEAQKIRSGYGIAAFTPQNQQRWNGLSKRLFAEKMTRLVQAHHPKAASFYNSAHSFSVDASEGLRSMAQTQAHWEIESLPSGFWGYFHFPRFARHVATLGQPWLGMTGRFQRMWGDFGGIKPKAALEFECFRSQAMGGGNSIGDQLPPRGKLDPAAYELIASVYEQVEAAEAFYQDSDSVFDIGVMLGSHTSVPAEESSLAEEGAVLALEEMHYNPAVLDDGAELEAFKAIVLTDTTVVTKKLKTKLEAYYQNGGKLLITYRGGFDEQANWALDFLPLRVKPVSSLKPTYWRARPEFWPQASRSDRVFYERGLVVETSAEVEVLVERVLPYFERSDAHHMSHFQAPPVRDAHPTPAVITGERFVLFADPVFGTYRKYGSTFYRDVLERCLHKLIGPPMARVDSRTVTLYARQRGNNLLLTLLHYIPLRKALEGDVIEEAQSFAGLTLQVTGAKEARVFGEQELEPLGEGRFALPNARGRLLIEVPNIL